MFRALARGCSRVDVRSHLAQGRPSVPPLCRAAATISIKGRGRRGNACAALGRRPQSVSTSRR
eukprot:2759331-Alexandrium_andersonii.AAC.1